MGGSVTLDDDFVQRQIVEAADRSPLHGTDLNLKWSGLRCAIGETIDRCLELFDRHRGIVTSKVVPRAHEQDRWFLNSSMDIVGGVLELDTVLPIYRRIIEVDWLAHVELDKEKRYRDHITHPVRVTAVGWWLLHREEGRLLEELAHRYERETEAYRAAKDIDLDPHEWPSIVEYAWLACGLLHDSAYPLEYHLRAAEDLREGYGDPLKIFAPQSRRFSTRRGRGVLLRPLEGSWLAGRLDLEDRMAALTRGRKKFQHAHAVLGPLQHLHSLGPRLHSLQGLVIQLAARAIFTHHDGLDDSVVADPLALLLFVSDNLQGWNRPFLHPSRSGEAEAVADAEGTVSLRPLVECDRIELTAEAESEGYVARFGMNPDSEIRAILGQEPYCWCFAEFSKPNRRLERLLRKNDLLPSIALSESRCIPPDFLDFMTVLRTSEASPGADEVFRCGAAVSDAGGPGSGGR